jgi:PAS domain S-box-containing protein
LDQSKIFKTLIDNTHVQLAYLDNEFNFIEVNKAYAEGCKLARDELIGKNHFTLFPNEENEKLFKSVRDSGKSISFKAKPFIYKDNPERGVTYWNWNLNPLRNDKGEVATLVLSLEEVTHEVTKRADSRKNILKLITLLSISIFTIQISVISALFFIHGQTDIERIFFSAALLIIFTFPVIYFLVYKPLIKNVHRRLQDKESYRRASDLLEASIEERTQDLADINRQLRDEIELKAKVETDLQQAKNLLEQNIDERTHQVLQANQQLQKEIKDREKIEMELESERKRLFSVLDEIPASVHLMAADHSIRFANRYFRDRFGEPKDQPCHKILHGSDVPCRLCEAKEVLRTKIPGEFEETHADGRLYHIYDYPFKDIDGEDLILQLGIDITDQKKAENDLRESEKKFRGLIHSMNDTVFTLDSEFNITAIYGNHLQQLGFETSNFLGKNISDIFAQNHAASHLHALKKVRAGKTAVYEWEARSNGDRVHLQNALSPIYDDKGKLTEIVGVARDITKQKTLERKLIQTEKLMAIAQMSAMISHEFRNSLTSLKMILELQLESSSLAINEKQSLQVALSSVVHMENIVGQLVSFSRPGPLKIGPANISDVLEESIQFIRIQIEKYKIKLKLYFNRNLPVLKLDAMRIKEAISNILLNSIQELSEKDESDERILAVRADRKMLTKKKWDRSYSNNDEVHNDYRAMDDQTETFLDAGEDCVWLQIEDNGEGMDEEELRHIFDPFYTTKTTGTGLGLALVRRVINEHGGIVTVKSKAGSGTKFDIYLPVTSYDTN